MASKDKANILLVDDQPAKLLTYEAILAGLGENLVKAGSGREALHHLMNMEIAVVLVDVVMPEMDGFELATLIREHPRFRDTAIILVSAVAVSDLDRLRGYDSGAVDYVPVPIVPELLRAKVAIFVELYRNREALRSLNSELEKRVAERTAALEASSMRLRESEERLRIALETGRLGAWDLDLARGSMQATAICNAILGLPPDAELDRNKLFACVYAPDRDAIQQTLQHAIETRSEFEGEYRFLAPDGSVRWIVTRGRPICDERDVPVRLLGVTLDITDRRRIEEERLVLLEREQAARLEAERAGRAKDEFLAMLSHELGSPLSIMMRWIDLMRTSAHDPAGIEQGLKIIERSVNALARIIDDLLDFNRVASGTIHIECGMLDLAATVDAAIESVRPAAQAKKIRIIQSTDAGVPPVRGDVVRMQQVLTNLLSNAVKFTPLGGQITITIRASDSHVELEVTDTGDGIDEEFLPHIFDRFRQANGSIDRRHGGLGLGLSIAKRLVELHGGTLEASSAGKGKGATFIVRLPVSRPGLDEKGEPDSAEAGAEPGISGARVHVADDP